jgi:hypothetical protein
MSQKLGDPLSSKTPALSPVNSAVISCGALAGGTAQWLCTVAISSFGGTTAFLPVQIVWQLVEGLFLGGLFGGYFVTSLASERKMKHCLVLSMLATLFALAGAIRLPESSEMFYLASERIPNLAAFILVAIPSAAGISIIIGGLSERILALIAKSIAVRRPWVYATRAGQQISVYGPRRNKISAFLWRAVASGLFLTCWTPFLIQVGIGYQVQYSLCVLVLAFVCLRLARQRSTPGARETLERDADRPIVYLRSFGHDGRRVREGLLYEATLGALVMLTAKTLEERLARIMKWRGSFLAIGKPNEELPESGAARLYVGEADWQSVVADLLCRPNAVALVQAGDTQGLRWELQQIRETLRLDQVLLFVPFGLWDLPPVREERYRHFRSWAQSGLGATLPEQIGDSCFMYFTADPDWHAHPLTKDQEAPVSHALFYILEALRADRSLWPRGKFSARKFLIALFIILLLVGGYIYSALHNRGGERGGGHPKSTAN